jgi:hypothetical protein
MKGDTAIALMTIRLSSPVRYGKGRWNVHHKKRRFSGLISPLIAPNAPIAVRKNSILRPKKVRTGRAQTARQLIGMADVECLHCAATDLDKRAESEAARAKCGG